ncbi:MAG: hydroxyacylglutathione hydrolase [Maricaulaceae bacterium]|jgi:hydroxyacylglutathione hydrolase
MPALEVHMFPCLSDNYGFLAHDPGSGETVAIDTPDPVAYVRAAESKGWTITQIWNTHHHADHAGGNEMLKSATGAKITGPGKDSARIPGMDVGVTEGDTVQLGGKTARVLETPGHTTGHIVYVFDEDRVAFVGDTMFALGCGRLFEGTPEVMWPSLQKLLALPDDTKIYCAHEYTQANARFALTVEPGNEALKERAAMIDKLRADNVPTVPTTIGLEKATSPFVRAKSAEIRARYGLEGADDVAVFAAVRKAKDEF